MINAEEIAKLPPLKRIKPLALALAYDFIPYAVGLALALLIAAAAYAATHPDKPVQETSPVATKQQSDCIKPVTIILWHMDANGHLHEIGSVVTVMDVCAQ
jgi:hypothetical protein